MFLSLHFARLGKRNVASKLNPNRPIDFQGRQMSVLLKIRDEVNTSRAAKKRVEVEAEGDRWRRGRKTNSWAELLVSSLVLALCPRCWNTPHRRSSRPGYHAERATVTEHQHAGNMCTAVSIWASPPHSWHSCFPGSPWLTLPSPRCQMENPHTTWTPPHTHTHTSPWHQVDMKAALLCSSLWITTAPTSAKWHTAERQTDRKRGRRGGRGRGDAGPAQASDMKRQCQEGRARLN